MDEKIEAFLKEAPTADEMKKAASDLGQEAAKLVQKYPVQTLLGAVAIGFLLGKWTNKKG